MSEPTDRPVRRPEGRPPIIPFTLVQLIRETYARDPSVGYAAVARFYGTKRLWTKNVLLGKTRRVR